MILSGLQKMTLLDYPGKIAATVFTGGCNFRCPFCHNASIVFGSGAAEALEEEAFFRFLEARQGLLDGVCVTGGEPLLHRDIAPFLSRIKTLGFLVKLDTNGSFPDALKALVGQGLVDYVAMDIKNAPDKYAETAGAGEDCLPPVRESVAFLLSGQVDYEFRTTVVQEFHAREDFAAIGAWIRGARRYFLQNFVDSGNLIRPGLSGVGKDKLEAFADIVRPFVPAVEIRGI